MLEMIRESGCSFFSLAVTDAEACLPVLSIFLVFEGLAIAFMCYALVQFVRDAKHTPRHSRDAAGQGRLTVVKARQNTRRRPSGLHAGVRR